ncbi:hypothetical protein BC830DRAFT_1085424 [Chytriomyces sp. MP71]|nr:hypothetical protein BC830DRAFT_1085424 [Chytriomyces sp. MP71]
MQRATRTCCGGEGGWAVAELKENAAAQLVGERGQPGRAAAVELCAGLDGEGGQDGECVVEHIPAESFFATTFYRRRDARQREPRHGRGSRRASADGSRAPGSGGAGARARTRIWRRGLNQNNSGSAPPFVAAGSTSSTTTRAGDWRSSASWAACCRRGESLAEAGEASILGASGFSARSQSHRPSVTREWKAGGKRVIQFDPRVGRISDMLVDYDEDRMYVGSLERGTVVVCNPSTGKVDREAVFFNDALEAQPISALLMERTRLVAGHLSGRVSMVTQFISRATPHHSMNHSAGFHNGSVSVLATLPNIPGIILSGGADGLILVWEVSTFQCLRKFVGNTTGIKFISCDAKNHLVACNEAGRVTIYDVDLMLLFKEAPIPLSFAEAPQSFQSRSLAHLSNSEPTQVHTLLHDPSSSAFITAVECPIPEAILLWSCVNTKEPLARFTHSTDAIKTSTISPVTIVAWDRSAMSPVSNSPPPPTTIASGHADSSVLLWNVPETVFTSPPSSQPFNVTPHRKIHVTVSSPLTTLHLDPFKLLASTADGLIKAYDVSTGAHIKSMSVRRGGEPGAAAVDLVARRRVVCVWGGEWNLIAATAAGHVRNWDFAPVVIEGREGGGTGRFKKKNRVGKARFVGGGAVTPTASGTNGTGRPASGGKFSGGSKTQFSLDVKSEVMATNLELKMEKEVEERRRLLLAKMNGGATPASPSGTFGVVGAGRTIGGIPGSAQRVASSSYASSTSSSVPPMTEQEMLDYAIMLSREEQEINAFSLGDSAYASTLHSNLNRSVMGDREDLTPREVRKSVPILDENSIFAPRAPCPVSNPKSITAKPPSGASGQATSISSSASNSIPRSPVNPWSAGKSFASVVASSASSSTNSLPSPGAFVFSETAPHTRDGTAVPRASEPSPTAASVFTQSPHYQFRLPTPWYEDDEAWEDERLFYQLNNGTDGYTPTKRRSSLSLSLAMGLPPAMEDNESANAMVPREPREWDNEDSGCSLRESLARSVNGSATRASVSSLSSSSSSLERKRFVLGASMESPGLVGTGLHIRRSPRLGPNALHVSPRLVPAATVSPSLAPTTSYSGVGVQVAPRATLKDEDEELMYVLELSLRDK